MDVKKNYKRIFVRAPLHTTILYEDDGFVYKTQLVNISLGGVLIRYMPQLPVINILPIVLDIPQIDSLDQYSIDEISHLEHRNFKRKIFRAKIRVIRRSESPLDVFIENIGSEFKEVSDELKEVITAYVNSSVRNISFLLSLLEARNSSPFEVSYVKKVAQLLGYGESGSLNHLYHEVKRDYFSLSSI